MAFNSTRILEEEVKRLKDEIVTLKKLYIDIMRGQIAEIEEIGFVGFEELAKYVLSGEPIKRRKYIDIEYDPKKVNSTLKIYGNGTVDVLTKSKIPNED